MQWAPRREPALVSPGWQGRWGGPKGMPIGLWRIGPSLNRVGTLDVRMIGGAHVGARPARPRSYHIRGVHCVPARTTSPDPRVVLEPMHTSLRALAVLLIAVSAAPADAAARAAKRPLGDAFAPADRGQSAKQSVKELRFGGSRLVLTFAPGDFRFTEQELFDWVLRSARATATYFGRFPVADVHITLRPTAGEEVMVATASAEPHPRIRMAVGRNTLRDTLKADSTMVHEMTHLGFPDLDDAHLWLHEGIATYVETVARAQAGEISAAAAWTHFVEQMPQGLPEQGDGGLDFSRSEDRLYWGGAMFCLVADVEIRQRTANRFGLRDALRAILNAGGTLEKDWELERTLATGDRAVGVPVLRELYAAWKDKSVAPDLDALWEKLGVHRDGDGVTLVDAAPLAPIRRAIMQPPARPLLLAGPLLVREATRRP